MTEQIAQSAPAAILAAATRLEVAAQTRTACSPVNTLIGSSDIAAAYAVQQELTARRIRAGARTVGRKIGLTSEAVQRQVGVDQPDFGVLFDDMAFEDGDVVPFGRLLQPKAEAEVAFTLRADILDADNPALVRASVAFAQAALEIVDSRVANWQIGITDTVADNASSGVFVLGATKQTLTEFSPIDVVMQMSRNGAIVSEGTGAACLGDPLNALTWLAKTAIELGAPLRAGDIVLSGALGPMVVVEPGDLFIANIGSLGAVTAKFSNDTAQKGKR